MDYVCVETEKDEELKMPKTELSLTEKNVVENYDFTDIGTIVADLAQNVLQIRDIYDDAYDDAEAKSDGSQDVDADFESDSSQSSWIIFDDKTFDDNEKGSQRHDSESTSSFPADDEEAKSDSDSDSESTSSVPEEYDELCQKVHAKYCALKKYMKKLKKPGGEAKHCLIYKEQDGTIKHRFFVDNTQALTWCYKNKESMEEDLPVILTTNRYDSSHSAQTTRKKKVGKAVVGRESSPNTTATLRVPHGTSEPKPMNFFLDTGADGGSVGYNRKVLQGFVFSMEEIEDEEKPVLFSQISIEGYDFEEIQTFDIDRNPHWNALGMEQIKHFDMYHSHEKDITVLVPPDNVQLRDSGACTEIVIQKENLHVPHRQSTEMSLPESESTINSISSSTIKDNSPTGATCDPSCLEISADATSWQTGVADANSLGATSNPSSSENYNPSLQQTDVVAANSLGATSNPSSSENDASLSPNKRVSSEIVADTNSVINSVDNTFNVDVNSIPLPL